MNLSLEEWWYNMIFKEYSRPRKLNQEHIWLCKTLRKLKLIMEITDDIDLVKDSLMIILYLLDDTPIDIYEKEGKDIRYLPLNEREKIKKLLKKTLIIKKNDLKT
jgi:hypothetical protein